MYCRTEEESTRETQPKPHIIHRPEDLKRYGWIDSEIQDIIKNKRAWGCRNRYSDRSVGKIVIPRNKLMYSYCFTIITNNQCKKCIIYDYTLPKYYLYIPFLVGIIFKNGYLNYYHIYNIIFGLHSKYFYLYVLKLREYSSIQFCKLLSNIKYCIYSLLKKTSTNEGLFVNNYF